MNSILVLRCFQRVAQKLPRLVLHFQIPLVSGHHLQRFFSLRLLFFDVIPANLFDRTFRLVDGVLDPLHSIRRRRNLLLGRANFLGFHVLLGFRQRVEFGLTIHHPRRRRGRVFLRKRINACAHFTVQFRDRLAGKVDLSVRFAQGNIHCLHGASGVFKCLAHLIDLPGRFLLHRKPTLVVSGERLIQPREFCRAISQHGFPITVKALKLTGQLAVQGLQLDFEAFQPALVSLRVAGERRPEVSPTVHLGTKFVDRHLDNGARPGLIQVRNESLKICVVRQARREITLGDSNGVHLVAPRRLDCCRILRARHRRARLRVDRVCFTTSIQCPLNQNFERPGVIAAGSFKDRFGFLRPTLIEFIEFSLHALGAAPNHEVAETRNDERKFSSCADLCTSRRNLQRLTVGTIHRNVERCLIVRRNR